MCRRIGQRPDDLHLLYDRAGPSMRNDERHLLLFRVSEGLGQAGATAIMVPPMETAMIYGIVPLARRLS
jgi:hypothetical protein